MAVVRMTEWGWPPHRRLSRYGFRRSGYEDHMTGLRYLLVVALKRAGVSCHR
jgi:hypothetical protein